MRYSCVIATILSLSLVVPMQGQSTGRVSGAVTDQTGAAVPNATVNLYLPGGSAPITSTTTSSEGLFTFAGIRPDTYDLEVAHSGFAKYMARRIKVDPARETELPSIKLEVQAVQQSIEVTATTEAVQTATNEIATTLSQRQVESLPVLDRQVSALFLTQPGVASGRGPTTINGLRTSFTTVTLDGINVQDNYLRDNALDYIPNKFVIEEVAEFTVATSNANPSIGGGAAHVVQSTRSGTNEFHGNARWYNRNNKAGANDWFNNRIGETIPFLNQNQAGAAVGGPIKKDKLLFYTNYEAFRNRQQSSTLRTTLTDTARQGILRYAGGTRQANLLQLRGVGVDPVMQNLLSLIPAGNSTEAGDGLNTTGYRFNARANEDRNAVLGKLDYIFSQRHNFSVTYSRNTDKLDRPDAGNNFTVDPSVVNDINNTLFSAAWRSTVTPTMTNEVRGGFLRADAPFAVTSEFPAFLVGGLLFSNPINTFQPQGRNTNTYHLQDNAAWVKGRHSVQFGYQGQFQRIAPYNNFGVTPTYTLALSTANQTGFTAAELAGISSFDLNTANTLYANLAGIVSGYNQIFNVTSRDSGFVNGAGNLRHYTYDNHAFYFADTWRVRPRFTLNLGVRYDYVTPVNERDALVLTPVLQGNYIDTLLSNHTLDFTGNSVGRPWYGKDGNNFAPNIGFAWDVFGNGKTSVRGGYSVSFVNDAAIVSAIGATVNGVNDGLSTSAIATNLNGKLTGGLTLVAVPQFKVPRTAADNYAVNTSTLTGAIDPTLATPYVQQFSFGVQREMWGNVLEVRYVGNHATKLYRDLDYNQVNIKVPGYFEDFLRARQNGFLAQAAGLGYDPRFNPNVAGSQQTPFFNTLPGAGLLNNATVAALVRQGEPGTLAQVYQTNRLNAPYNFFPNPVALQMRALTNYSNSTYNSLQVEMRRALRSGLDLAGSYVYSKVLSDSAGTVQDRFEEFLDINNPSIERARAPFDLTHVFKVFGGYELPMGKGKMIDAGRWNHLIGGWKISGFLTWQSGTVFSVLSTRGTLNRAARSPYNTAVTTLTGDDLQNVAGFFMTGNGPFFINPANRAPDGRGVASDGAAPFSGQVFSNPEPGQIGTLQRRFFDGPNYLNLDMAVLKKIPITERHSLEFRAEAFNLPNHPSFYVGNESPTNTARFNINSATFGRIIQTLNQPRIMQFGLYYRF